MVNGRNVAGFMVKTTTGADLFPIPSRADSDKMVWMGQTEDCRGGGFTAKRGHGCMSEY